MTEALLEVRGGSFGYGGRPIVSGVDLRVDAGSFAAVVGGNGTGKTTLFRGLLGLIEPLAGSVLRADAPLGYVPQRESLDAVYPLTVTEVVAMGAFGGLRGLRRLSTAERGAVLGNIAAVGLAEHARSLFASLSGGQRQRALIARALTARPRVLLLDEPTSAVDEQARVAIHDLLRRLQAEEHMGILIVTHDADTLRSLVQEVHLVADGRVRSGPPDDVLGEAIQLHAPASPGLPGASE